MTAKEHEKILLCVDNRWKSVRQDKLDIAVEYALRLYNDDQNERESLEAFQELQKEETAVADILRNLIYMGPTAARWRKGVEND